MIFRELRLRKRRHEKYSTPEMLYYSHLVDEGIIALKDGAVPTDPDSGSLMRTYRVRGLDLKTTSELERLAINYHANNAFNRFTDGWMIQSDTVRRPIEEYPENGAFPDPVTRLIDRQREAHYRAEGVHFETLKFLTLTYRPPSMLHSRGRKLFIADSVPERERHIYHFLKTTDAFAADLTNRLELTPLDSAEILSFIESCIIGRQVQIRAPELYNYLDTWLGRHRFVKGIQPSIGGRTIRVVTPTGLPLDSHAEICEFLGELPFPYRYSARAILLGTHSAKKFMRTRRSQHYQKRRRPWDFLKETTGTESDPAFLNEEAVELANDANAAIKEVESNQVRALFLTMNVVLIGENGHLLNTQAEYVRQQFEDHLFQARINDFNTIEAWRGSLPGDGWSDVTKPVVHSLHLVDLIPMSSLWTGDRYCPNPMYPPKSPPIFYATSHGSTPFRFHFHVSDVGHGIIIGTVGAGKSTLLCYMIAQAFRIPEMQAFVFDKGRSFYALAKACGGEHWDLGEDVLKAAPLINVDQPVEAEWAHGYISYLLVKALKRDLRPLENDALWRAIELLAGRPKRYRTMTALQTLLQSDDLKSAINRYTAAGQMGRYLDHNEDVLLDSRFLVFEMENLLNSDALGPVLLYLFHRIEQRSTGRPTILAIDEAATLALADTIFGPQLEQWYRDKRKANTAVWISTQSLSDLQRSLYRHVLLESAATKIFLPNPEAASENIAAVYRDFDVPDHLIKVISEAIPKSQYLLISPRGRRLFETALDPVTLAFTGVSFKDDVRRVKDLVEQYGDHWPVVWLQEHGLKVAADELARDLPEHQQFMGAAS